MYSFTPLIVDLPNIEPVVTSILGGGWVFVLRGGDESWRFGSRAFRVYWFFGTSPLLEEEWWSGS